MNISWIELRYVIIGLCGLLLLVSGTRLYRFAIMGPGVIIGAYIGTIISVGQEDVVQLVAISFSAILGGVAMLLVEKLGIAVMGALLGGGSVHIVLPLLQDISVAPWYYVALGSMLGAMIFPPFFSHVAPIVTSIFGAIAIVYSFGEYTIQTMNWTLVLGLTVLGTLIQWYFGATLQDEITQ